VFIRVRDLISSFTIWGLTTWYDIAKSMTGQYLLSSALPKLGLIIVRGVLANGDAPGYYIKHNIYVRDYRGS